MFIVVADLLTDFMEHPIWLEEAASFHWSMKKARRHRNVGLSDSESSCLDYSLESIR